jgi:hypothetical protein
MNSEGARTANLQKSTTENLIRIWVAAWLCFWGQTFVVLAQPFSISSVIVTNHAVKLNFPGRSDSYYFLFSAPMLNSNSTPISAQLGSGGYQAFQDAITGKASFFRVQQLPIAGTNSLLGDGISDGWKLQHGLSPFGPSVAGQIPLGDTRTWLQIYQADAISSQLPVASCAVLATNIIAGASNVAVQVRFSKNYSGNVTYQVTGTAVPSATGLGDYIPPSGIIAVSNATSATISITLTPPPAIELARTLLVALSIPSSNVSYTISTNSVETVQILPSAQGVFLGTLAITNGPLIGVQPVKMALRQGGNGNTAFFDLTPSPLLGNTFSVHVVSSQSGFQLNGQGYTNQISNTPWGRNMNLNFAFGFTTTNGTVFSTPVTIGLGGLTASGKTYNGSGTLTLSKSQ